MNHKGEKISPVFGDEMHKQAIPKAQFAASFRH